MFHIMLHRSFCMRQPIMHRRSPLPGSEIGFPYYSLMQCFLNTVKILTKNVDANGKFSNNQHFNTMISFKSRKKRSLNTAHIQMSPWQTFCRKRLLNKTLDKTCPWQNVSFTKPIFDKTSSWQNIFLTKRLLDKTSPWQSISLTKRLYDKM
jgi:hypothetical protein